MLHPKWQSSSHLLNIVDSFCFKDTNIEDIELRRINYGINHDEVDLGL